MRGIVKRFPGVLANDHIDFDVHAGEIHALLGENGAGKTTLMNVLYGLYQPDEGEIYVNGRRVVIGSPYQAIKLGIGMVHQHFMLAQPLTVAENVVLGLPSPREPLLDLAQAEKRINEISQAYGLKVDPRAQVWQLAVGEQQRVEIIKALYRQAALLILDEPTAVLTPQEVKELFVVLRRMAEQGHAIIFITHKLHEVMALSDRITVLKAGRVVATVNRSDATPEKLAQMMVGREVLFRLPKEKVEKGRVILQVKSLEALGDKGLPALKEVSLAVHQREILGIAGVSGNGQRELAEVIAGLRPAREGKVLIDGQDVTNRSPCDIIEQGLAYIPEERLQMGVVTDFSVAENMILETHGQRPFADGGFLPLNRCWFLNRRAIEDYATQKISEYDVKTPDLRTPARHLSGGNIQRLILARELSRQPKLLLAAQPTRGLDIGATEYIRRKLLEERARGTAILLISEDLDEILALSDRIAVMYEGEIVGIVPGEGADVEQLGLMMAGALRLEAGPTQ
ncbi:MAG: ABC transporter ATP-binding protein [Chloroflexi bacterium]|nr:ABC transporter ATP-binding protein [Chloroflexota bacterium]